MNERRRWTDGGGEWSSRGGSRPACVLTINGGSSSLKFAVFEVDDLRSRVLSGRVERIGRGPSRLIAGAAVRAVGWRGLAAAADVRQAVAFLESRNWLRVKRVGTGGSATELVYIHPALLSGGEA